MKLFGSKRGKTPQTIKPQVPQAPLPPNPSFGSDNYQENKKAWAKDWEEAFTDLSNSKKNTKGYSFPS